MEHSHVFQGFPLHRATVPRRCHWFSCSGWKPAGASDLTTLSEVAGTSCPGPSSRMWMFTLLALAGGLILCVRSILKQMNYSCLSVCNPLTKSWRDLSPRDLPVTTRVKAPMLVSMVYDRPATAFKVVVAGGRRCYRTGSSLDEVGESHEESEEDTSSCCWNTHVYDSATDSWRETYQVPEGSCLRATSAVFDGELYALRRTGEILTYDLEKGVSSDLRTPAVTICCDVACLTRTCGALHLAGYAREQGVQSLRIWCLRIWRMAKPTSGTKSGDCQTSFMPSC